MRCTVSGQWPQFPKGMPVCIIAAWVSGGCSRGRNRHTRSKIANYSIVAQVPGVYLSMTRTLVCSGTPMFPGTHARPAASSTPLPYEIHVKQSVSIVAEPVQLLSLPKHCRGPATLQWPVPARPRGCVSVAAHTHSRHCASHHQNTDRLLLLVFWCWLAAC